MKIGDKVIINTRGYGLHNIYGSVLTITYISDGRLLYGSDGWVVDIEDVIPVTPLLEALC
jgi:hypothetical protein